MTQILTLLKKLFPDQMSEECDQILIEYHGGGYDGCFWEWNYSLVEFSQNKSEIDNFISTGYNGCKSSGDLLSVLQNYEVEPVFKPVNIYLIPTEWPKALDEIPLSFLPTVATKLELPIKCSHCGKDTDVVMGIGYHGIGGIMSAPSGLVCEECWCSNTCEDCGEYTEEGVDENGFCEYCAKEQ